MNEANIEKLLTLIGQFGEACVEIGENSRDLDESYTEDVNLSNEIFYDIEKFLTEL